MPNTKTTRCGVDVRAPMIAVNFELPPELTRPSWPAIAGADAVALATQLGLPVPTAITDAVAAARKIADNIRLAEQRVGAMQISIEEMAGEGGADLLIELAERSALGRPTRGTTVAGVGPAPLDKGVDFFALRARRLIASAITQAAPEIFAGAAQQWVDVHRVIATLPQPVDTAIDPGSVSAERFAQLGHAAAAADRAATIRRLRDMLCRLVGERTAQQQSDAWSCFYRLADNPSEAVAMAERMWDRYDGVSDRAAPWRAIRAGAQPGLARQAEADRRVQLLRAERNRIAALNEEASRQRSGRPPYLVHGADAHERIFTDLAEAEKRRRIENASPAAQHG